MDNINLYKELTLKIIENLNKENIDDLENLFNQRENILQEEKENKDFKKSMIEIGIIDLDKKIKALMNQIMIKIKLDIKNQKISTIANNCYINANRDNLNIFNKKV